MDKPNIDSSVLLTRTKYAMYPLIDPLLTFSKVFKTVTDFHGPGSNIFFSLFVHLTRSSENRSLCIDLGCGSGQATVSLAKHFQNVIGFEPSQGQLDQIKEKPGSFISFFFAY